MCDAPNLWYIFMLTQDFNSLRSWFLKILNLIKSWKNSWTHEKWAGTCPETFHLQISPILYGPYNMAWELGTMTRVPGQVDQSGRFRPSCSDHLVPLILGFAKISFIHLVICFPKGQSVANPLKYFSVFCFQMIFWRLSIREKDKKYNLKLNGDFL